jgi:hypothetical protein
LIYKPGNFSLQLATSAVKYSFVRAGGSTPQDKPHYKLKSHPIRKLLTASINNNISIGLHSSYEAGINPGLIAQEHNNLENAIIQPVKYNRHHYLSSRDPRDMEELEKAGITDDFTMGMQMWQDLDWAPPGRFVGLILILGLSIR